MHGYAGAGSSRFSTMRIVGEDVTARHRPDGAAQSMIVP